MLYLIIGVIYDRAHQRGVTDFVELANQIPKYFGIVVIAFFASMGLPGLSGFISEALAFLGAFSVSAIRVITIVSTLGIVLTAGYMLWTLQRMFFGNVPDKWKDLTDINGRELAILVPLAAIIIILGIYPAPVLNMMSASVNQLVDFVYKTSNMTIAGW